MQISLAWDIESCARCPFLIFPGDEITTTGAGPVHLEHEVVDSTALVAYT